MAKKSKLEERLDEQIDQLNQMFQKVIEEKEKQWKDDVNEEK